MSGGKVCKCNNPDWEVVQYKCNYSDFEYPKGKCHRSEWSGVVCNSCGAYWRTKAKYVDSLPERDTRDTIKREVKSYKKFLPY